jgi:hypothetical protein
MKLTIPREMINSAILYMREMKLENVKMVSYNPMTQTATIQSDPEPTDEQATQIISNIPIIRKNYRLQGIDKFDNIISDLSTSQIDTYIDKNITNLDSTKTYLKRLSRAVLFLYERLDKP